MTAVPGTAEAESVRIGERVAKALLAIDGVQSVAQWVGRAPGGADTFGAHYSEFEVEIGTVEGEAQARILREIRETVFGRRPGGVPGGTMAMEAFTVSVVACTWDGKR